MVFLLAAGDSEFSDLCITSLVFDSNLSTKAGRVGERGGGNVSFVFVGGLLLPLGPKRGECLSFLVGGTSSATRSLDFSKTSELLRKIVSLIRFKKLIHEPLSSGRATCQVT